MDIEIWQVIIAACAVVVSVIEVSIKASARNRWREDVEREVSIYRSMETSPGLKGEKTAMKQLRSSIVGTIDKRLSEKQVTSPFLRFVYAVSMLLLSSFACVMIVFVATFTGNFSTELALNLLYFLGVVALIEIIVNVGDILKSR